MQCSSKGADSQLAVIQAGRVHQNPTAWEEAARDLPGIKSIAVMLPALPLSYMIHGKEKVETRRTGYTIFPKDDILFPS